MRVRDAVGEESERDRRLQQADVAGPEREEDDDVHEQENERRRVDSCVDLEGEQCGPHREELRRPAEELEAERPHGRRRAAQDGQARARHRDQAADVSRALGRLLGRSRMAPGEEKGSDQEAQPDADHDGERRLRPFRDA